MEETKNLFKDGDQVTCYISSAGKKHKITDAKLSKDGNLIRVNQNIVSGGANPLFGYKGAWTINLTRGKESIIKENVSEFALINRKPTKEELEMIKETYIQD
jgi:hypothetical protein